MAVLFLCQHFLDDRTVTLFEQVGSITPCSRENISEGEPQGGVWEDLALVIVRDLTRGVIWSGRVSGSGRWGCQVSPRIEDRTGALPVTVRKMQWLLSRAVDPVCSDVFFSVWEFSWSDAVLSCPVVVAVFV